MNRVEASGGLKPLLLHTEEIVRAGFSFLSVFFFFLLVEREEGDKDTWGCMMHFGVTLPSVPSPGAPLLSVGPWASYFISQKLCCLITKMGINNRTHKPQNPKYVRSAH